MLENLPTSTVFTLADAVSCRKFQMCSRSLCSTPGADITMLAFDQGTKIWTHAAPGDAISTILEGEAEITISGTTYTVRADESIVMPAGEPHSLRAVTIFKMLLVLVKN